MENEIQSPSKKPGNPAGQSVHSGAFRLHGLSLNADFSAMNESAEPSGSWYLLDEAYAWIAQAVAEDIKSLAVARGFQVSWEQALAEAAIRLRLAGPRPDGGFREAVYMARLFLRGLAASFRLQGEVAAALRARARVGA